MAAGMTELVEEGRSALLGGDAARAREAFVAAQGLTDEGTVPGQALDGLARVRLSRARTSSPRS